jgi:hypothetical protein
VETVDVKIWIMVIESDASIFLIVTKLGQIRVIEDPPAPLSTPAEPNLHQFLAIPDDFEEEEIVVKQL